MVSAVVSRLYLLCVCLLAMIAGNDRVIAQDVTERPVYAADAVLALGNSKWIELNPGLKVLQADTALGTKLTALRLSQDQYGFSVVQQNKADGERASSVLEREEAELVINGGFFKVNEAFEYEPVGLLKDDGEVLSTAWKNSGGYLSLSDGGRLSITTSGSGLPASATEIIQSRPVILEPGGRWAMRTNGSEKEKRTIVCLLASEDIILLVVSGGGLSLFEAGWVLRSTDWGGYFDCDSAIALDGGGSTQVSVKGQPQLKISGLTSVQNFLVVNKRMPASN